jgi:hypothetical protein
MPDRLVVLLVAFIALAAPAAAQDVHVAVIVGLAGDPEHGELFNKWAASLVQAATERFGIPAERLVYLAAENPEDGPSTALEPGRRPTGRPTRDRITQAFDAIAKRASKDDVVFVMLIGHGTFDGRTAKFNLPGPDMTPADFVPLLKRMTSKLVFVNAASASGPFVAELSGPGRTIVTATRTGTERFATLFGGYFIDALTGDTADGDKNRRISILEAFEYARREVARAYERAGIMVTEHALLDDSGDREGAMEPNATGKDGRMAAVLSLGAVTGGDPLPSDPRLRALYEQRRDLERRVDALKLLKGSMESAQYAADLEKLLTELARKTREIKTAEGSKE